MSDDLETQTLAALQAARETTGGRISLKAYISEKGQISDVVLQLHGDEFYPTLIDDTKVHLLKELGELQAAWEKDAGHVVHWTDSAETEWCLPAAEAISVYTRLLADINEKTVKFAADNSRSSYDKVQGDPNLQRSASGDMLLRNVEMLEEQVLVSAPPPRKVAIKARAPEATTFQMVEKFARHIKENWPLALYRFSYSVRPGKFASISPFSAA